MDRMALSYGTGLDIVVDPVAGASANVEIDGALLVGAGPPAIRTRGFESYSDVILAIDTLSWQAERASRAALRWRFAVLAWELRLSTNPVLDPPLTPVFRFRAEG